MLVYDVFNRASFTNTHEWFGEVERHTVPGVALYLVGAKLDKADPSRAVSFEEGAALAEAHGAGFCEASARTRENVKKPFVEMVDWIARNPGLLGAASRQRTDTVAMSPNSDSYLPGCSC